MGGIVKYYGAASDPEIANIRLDERARKVHAMIYGLLPEDVMTGWDAFVSVGSDAYRFQEPGLKSIQDSEKLFYAMTG